MNDEIVTYDTETTGIPNWKIPSDSPEQPHIVQIAAVLADKSGVESCAMDVIIKPDGWLIPDEVISIHGITNEMAMDVGISEKEAVQMLLDICGDARRVAYNKTFDQRIIRIALKRFMDEKAIEKWAVKDDHDCAMMMAKQYLGVKSIKLVDAYKEICGKDLVGAHSAIADARAAMEIYFKILES